MLDLTLRTVNKEYHCHSGIDFEESTYDLSYGECGIEDLI